MGLMICYDFGCALLQKLLNNTSECAFCSSGIVDFSSGTRNTVVVIGLLTREKES